MITLDGYKPISGSICAPRGFTAAGLHAGIKKKTDNDLSLIYCEKICAAAALYTTNKVKGAPLLVTQNHLLNGRAQAVIINSGNANTCNAGGEEIAIAACNLTAKALNIDATDVLVASTGVIGQPLSIEPFKEHIPELVSKLRRDGDTDCIRGIMTTDTREKKFCVEFEIAGKICRLGGICKGSGMIHPNMATMLAFITTDVNITSDCLKEALRSVNEATFSMMTVDGDTSTNDMVAILASGLAGNPRIATEISSEGEDFQIFTKALYAVCANMAREMARDGEGATKLLECKVVHAASVSDAHKVAKSVVGSSLVKAAMFAADANWGRILCAAGYAGADFDPDKICVEFGSRTGRIIVCSNGRGVPFSEEEATELLSGNEIQILINLKQGNCEATAWGCDLTYDYVKINAEYRS